MSKRYLLASAAVATLAATGQAQARDFYVSVLGGGNWWQDQSHAGGGESGTVLHFDADQGFMIGGAVGVHLDNWLRGLRTELEASYRRNRMNGQWSTSEGDTGAIIGHVSTFALMANVWYDIDIGTKFKPYVGGGAGWARSHIDVALFTSDGAGRPNPSSEFDVSGFAWQIGAGINYPVMPGVDLGLGYRYSVEPGLSLKNGGEFGGEGFGGENPFKIENQNHSVALTLTIDIE